MCNPALAKTPLRTFQYCEVIALWSRIGDLAPQIDYEICLLHFWILVERAALGNPKILFMMWLLAEKFKNRLKIEDIPGVNLHEGHFLGHL